MHAPAGSVTSDALRGARLGAYAGAVLASVEALLLTLCTRATLGAAEYVDAPPAATFACLAAFAIAGAAWGALAGALAGRVGAREPAEQRDARIRLAVALGIPLASILLVAPEGRGEVSSIAIGVWTAGVAAAALAAGFVVRGARRAAADWLGPWTLAALVAGVPWWLAVPLRAFREPSYQTLASLVLAGAVLVAAWSARKALLPVGRGACIALASAVIAALAASASLRSAPAVSADDRVIRRASDGQGDVVLISLGGVRADHVSLYGYGRDTTPKLREVARAATVFRRTAAAADQPLASHASLFTGLSPRGHGARTDGDAAERGRPLRPDANTLADILAASGLRTVGIVADSLALSRRWGIDQGFDTWDDRPAPTPLGRAPSYTLRASLVRALELRVTRLRGERELRGAEAVVDEALAWIERLHAAGERWFLFLELADARLPAAPPPPFDAQFPGVVRDFDPRAYPALVADVLSGRAALDPRVRDHLIARYDGAIAYEDAQIGRVVAKLVELGLWEDCLFVVTGDHGEALGEDNLLGHGVSVGQPALAVPLLVKFPDAKAPANAACLVHQVDVLPTLLDILGVRVADRFHGRSAARWSEFEPHAAVSESLPATALVELGPRFSGPQRAVYWDRAKLIRRPDGTVKLYDLVQDPREARPINDLYPDVVAKLSAELDRFLLEVPPARGPGAWQPSGGALVPESAGK